MFNYKKMSVFNRLHNNCNNNFNNSNYRNQKTSPIQKSLLSPTKPHSRNCGTIVFHSLCTIKTAKVVFVWSNMRSLLFPRKVSHPMTMISHTEWLHYHRKGPTLTTTLCFTSGSQFNHRFLYVNAFSSDAAAAIWVLKHVFALFKGAAFHFPWTRAFCRERAWSAISWEVPLSFHWQRPERVTWTWSNEKAGTRSQSALMEKCTQSLYGSERADLRRTHHPGPPHSQLHLPASTRTLQKQNNNPHRSRSRRRVSEVPFIAQLMRDLLALRRCICALLPRAVFAPHLGFWRVRVCGSFLRSSW